MMLKNLTLKAVAIISIGFLPSISHSLTLKIATLAPAGTHWMKEMKKGAEIIKQRTSGRVKIKYYPGGVMGNDQSVHRKIRINQLQGGAFSASGLAPIDPAIQVLSLPMLFNSFDEVDYIRDRMDPVIKAHMLQHGFRILGISEGGFARILSRESVDSMDAIRKTRVWIPEGDQIVLDTFETMGIEPVALPISDVFTGLQTGLIDTITSTSTGAIAFQWHSRVNYMVDLPVLYVIGVMAVSEKAFSRIKPDDQTIVLEEMQKVFAGMDKTNRANNQQALSVLKSSGITVQTPSQQEKLLWKTLSNQSIDRMLEKGDINPEVLSELLTYLDQYRNNTPAVSTE